MTAETLTLLNPPATERRPCRHEAAYMEVLHGLEGTAEDIRSAVADLPEPEFLTSDIDQVVDATVATPLRRAADLAHRDTGHIGRLDMCSEELCRALSDAGAD